MVRRSNFSDVQLRGELIWRNYYKVRILISIIPIWQLLKKTPVFMCQRLRPFQALTIIRVSEAVLG